MAVTNRKPSFSGVCDAFEKLKLIVPPTPLMPIHISGKTIWCKCESLQPMGAFKLRGAWHRLTALPEKERNAGVVAFSSGNHAQGIAWAAQRLAMPATIVMPSDAPALKIAGTARMGADIIFYDRLTESREEIALDLAQKKGAVLVPSFDDPWVIEGQGTAGLEALEQMFVEGLEAPDLIVTPCGGGGLAAGLALAIPSACVVTVEPEGWDDMAVSLSCGKIIPVALHPPKTSCDALQTLRVSPLTFEVLLARNALGVAVTENEVFEAMRFAKTSLNLVLEPGGAVALAAMLAGKVTPKERTLLMLSGGNVDPDLFDHVMVR
ncbi:MAG: threonine/serine dehydratase [Chakrabartia sp.]